METFSVNKINKDYLLGILGPLKETTMIGTDIPDFLRAICDDMMKYHGIDSDRISPEVTIKTGGREQRITFTKPTTTDHVGRFFVNFGPHDNFCYRKFTGSGPKKLMEDFEFSLYLNQGVYVKMEHDDCDLMLYPNPRRYLEFTEISRKNGKTGKIVDVDQYTKYSIRSSSHKSVLMTIVLWLKKEQPVDLAVPVLSSGLGGMNKIEDYAEVVDSSIGDIGRFEAKPGAVVETVESTEPTDPEPSDPDPSVETLSTTVESLSLTESTVQSTD